MRTQISYKLHGNKHGMTWRVLYEIRMDWKDARDMSVPAPVPIYAACALRDYRLPSEATFILVKVSIS